jgi:hypothetical protein
MPCERRKLNDMGEENSPRRKCYHDVRGAGARAIASYYKKHPDRIEDACYEDTVKMALDVVTGVLGVLDEYEIADKPK